MVLAPLLSLVLYTVFGYGHAVEAQAANGGFRLSRTDAHGLHSGNLLKALHEAAAQVGLDKLLAHVDHRL